MALDDIYQTFSITPDGQQTLVLTGALEALDDDLGARLASFEYLKRDGAAIEPMGAQQARFSFRVVLMGSAPLYPGGSPISAGARYLALAQAQRTQPRCQLNHPRLGQWKVGWLKIRAHEQPQRAIDTIELTLEFLEDQTDAAIAAEIPTPQARAQSVVDAYSVLQAAVALRFSGAASPVMAAVVSTTDVMAATAGAFTTDALLVAQGQVVSPSIDTQFGYVVKSAEETIAALDASLAYSLDNPVELVPFKHQAYMVWAFSAELLLAIADQKPVLIDYTLPAAMSLDQVLVTVYGADAANHRDEALTNNRIATPLWMPQGYRVRLVAPQVRQ